VFDILCGQRSITRMGKVRLARRMTRILHTLSSKIWAATSSNFVFTNYSTMYNPRMLNSRGARRDLGAPRSDFVSGSIVSSYEQLTNPPLHNQGWKKLPPLASGMKSTLCRSTQMGKTLVHPPTRACMECVTTRTWGFWLSEKASRNPVSILDAVNARDH
jgi:hypothetical protein